jgi:protein-arginine kinase activator protein McsA
MAAYGRPYKDWPDWLKAWDSYCNRKHLDGAGVMVRNHTKSIKCEHCGSDWKMQLPDGRATCPSCNRTCRLAQDTLARIDRAKADVSSHYSYRSKPYDCLPQRQRELAELMGPKLEREVNRLLSE